MEVDEIQTQACKLSRISNSRNDSNKIGRKGGDQYQLAADEDEEDGDQRKGGGGINGMTAASAGTAIVGAAGFDVGSHNDNGRLRAWNSSRIFRVSRASGGKDRHSKVLTAKGLRDRRVRLSVSTAIQFYDLQDRLGYDQPSKAVEWLIKAAADAIAELPSLNTAFPDTPKQLSGEKSRPNAETRFDLLADLELETDPSNYQHQHQQQHISLSKSACSSTSETSKGSVLSLSRSEIRVKARERARERTAKDKEKEKPDEAPHHSSHHHHHHHHQQNSQSSSFTELLTGSAHNSQNPSLSAAQHQNPSFSNFLLKQNPHSQMDYFTGLFGGPGSMRNHSNNHHHYSLGYSGQTHFGNASPTPHTMGAPPPPFTVTGDHHHQELQQFSFLPDQLIPDATAAAGSDYNLNCTISSGIAGFNRGTLQSNSSQSQLPHHLQQRYSSPSDGPSMPFFIGNVATAAASAAAPTEHHQFPTGFDGRLQLCYGDGANSHSDLKGKRKS